MPTLRYSVDKLLVHEGQLVAYGWGFLPGAEVGRVLLRLDFDGELPCVELEADYGRQRDDVKADYPDCIEAENAGFLLLGGVPLVEAKRAVLRWEFINQQAVEIPLVLPFGIANTQPVRIAPRFGALIRKGLALLRTEGLTALAGRLRRRLVDHLWKIGVVRRVLVRVKLRGKPLAIIVDHDMGGGANIYRVGCLRELRSKGDIVVLLSFHVGSLQYFIEIFDARGSRRFFVDSPASLVELTSGGNVRHIVYNCAVSFRQPLTIIEPLIALKENSSAELLVMVHDFFVICPSHTLIDEKDSFCGVPDLDRCIACLSNHRDGFVSMTGVRDITRWRWEWSRLLASADEVRMFSESSKRLLKRAYPQLNDAKWCVVPHELHTAVPKVRLSAGSRPHIGIVGTIGKHKGARIVRELAKEITQGNLNIQMTVIGTLDVRAPSDVITITGPYKSTALPEMIVNSGANIFLFPSIWPETFSYVSHELIAMGVPLACFNLGAPADSTKSYDYGLILESRSARDILRELESFWRKIYMDKEDIV